MTEASILRGEEMNDRLVLVTLMSDLDRYTLVSNFYYIIFLQYENDKVIGNREA